MTQPTGIPTAAHAAALVGIVRVVRPDWHQPQLEDLFREHWQTPAPFADIAIAALTKAQDMTLRAPDAIFNPGPHWPEPARPRIPRGPACPQHPEEDLALCRCCAADRLAEPPEPVTRECEDHPSHSAGLCSICWDEIQAGTRPKARLGLTNRPPRTHNHPQTARNTA